MLAAWAECLVQCTLAPDWANRRRGRDAVCLLWPPGLSPPLSGPAPHRSRLVLVCLCSRECCLPSCVSSRQMAPSPTHNGPSSSSSDPMMDLLTAYVGPRAFPIQPAPVLSSPERNNNLLEVTILGQKLAAFVVGGEPRVCFTQFMSCVEQYVRGEGGCEVERVVHDLSVHLQQASPAQLRALQGAAAVPPHSLHEFLIRMSDAERVEAELRVDTEIEPLRGSLASLPVEHNTRSRAVLGYIHTGNRDHTIECSCGSFFHGKDWVKHECGEEAVDSGRTQHWGLDANKWKNYITVSMNLCGDVVSEMRLESWKNPPSLKRKMEGDMESEDSKQNVAVATLLDHLRLFMATQRQREDDLKRGIVGDVPVSADVAMSVISSMLPQPSLNVMCASLNPGLSKPLLSLPTLSTVSLDQHLPHQMLPLQAAVVDQHAGPSNKCVEEEEEEEEQIEVVRGADDDDLMDMREERSRLDSEDSAAEMGTLDWLLDQHVAEPARSAIRASIAASQSTLEQRVDELSSEAALLRAENTRLRITNMMLTAQLPPELKELHGVKTEGKQMAPPTLAPPPVKKMSSDMSKGDVSQLKSSQLMQLLIQQHNA